MREYPAAPLPGALAMVMRDCRFLLVCRANEPDRGKWGLPGGMVEAGETPEQAAVRELAEETGVVAAADHILDRFEVEVPDGAGRVRFHYALTVVMCRWIAGEPVAGEDAFAAEWFAPDEIAGLPTSRELPRLVAKALTESGF